MEKITFIDGQAPGISANNLNQIQTNVEEAINNVEEAINNVNNANTLKGDFLNVTLSEDLTLSSTDYTTLPLTSTRWVNGSSLSVNSNGQIVIGDNISAISVSGQAYYYTGTTGQKIIQIRKNNEIISRVQLQDVPRYTMLVSPNQSLNVSKGDVIDIQFSGTSGDVIKAYPFTTFLSVEVVK